VSLVDEISASITRGFRKWEFFISSFKPQFPGQRVVEMNLGRQTLTLNFLSRSYLGALLKYERGCRPSTTWISFIAFKTDYAPALVTSLGLDAIPSCMILPSHSSRIAGVFPSKVFQETSTITTG
jgi:hypothetical protein